jgi:hypothetical protein
VLNDLNRSANRIRLLTKVFFMRQIINIPAHGGNIQHWHLSGKLGLNFELILIDSIKTARKKSEAIKMISSSIKYFLVVSFFAFGFTKMAYCQANGYYFIEPFRLHSYTAGFTKGLEYSFELSGQNENIVMNGQYTYTQDVGRKVSRFGKEWIGVSHKGLFKYNEEKNNVNGIDLYDIGTKSKIYSIDNNDGEINQYVWGKIPEKMKSGETIVVARFSKRGKDKKVRGTGSVEWSFTAAPTGYEFCQIEKTIELKRKEESESRDCEIFDSTRKIVGGYIEIMIEKSLQISGGGPIKLR